MLVSNGKPNKVNMINKEPIDVVSEKLKTIETTSIEITPMLIQAPILLVDPIAKIKIEFNNGFIYEGYLYPEEEILELEYLDIVFDYFIKFLLS